MADQDGFLLLYGSQTGQSKGIAEDIAAEAVSLGIACRLLCMDQYNDKEAVFPGESTVIVVVSTTGEGDPPDNASRMWRRMKSKKCKTGQLAHLSYTVLGLGDTNYSNFCQMGKSMNARFAELGATCFYPPGFADDGTGLEVVVEPWREGLFPALAKLSRNGCVPDPTMDASSTGQDGGGSIVAAVVDTAGPACDYTPAEDEPAVSDLKMPRRQPAYLEFRASGNTDAEGQPESQRAADTSPQYLTAAMTGYKVLTTPDAVKRTIAVDIKLPLDRHGQAVQYEPGDTFAIACPNDPSEVVVLISRCGWTDDFLDKPVELGIIPATDKRGAVVPQHLAGARSLRECIEHRCDLRGAISKGGIRVLAECTSDPEEVYRLQVLCSRHGAEDYRARVTSGSASILAILDRYTTCMPSAARILELLPAAKPRRYSAASSPLGPSGPSNVRFVLNVVERGLCSGFLDRVGRGLGPACTGVDSSCVDDSGADAASNQDEGAAPASSEVRLYRENHATRFNPPTDTSLPLVLVATGTGLAPFLGFLEHRRALMRCSSVAHGESKEFGPSMLFFGLRHKGRDYICKNELDSYVADGTLTKLYPSFSRCDGTGARSGYVDAPMCAHGAEIATLMLDLGGTLAVCGNSDACVGTVSSAVTNVLVAHRGMSEPDASKTKIAWRTTGKYLVEHYAG